MNLLDAVFAYLAPHECLGCSVQGKLLCKDCSLSLPGRPEVHLSCGGSVFARTTYIGHAKSLVWKLKAGSARAAADEIASLLPPIKCDTVVPVPTASSRVRQRGYDQAVLIAKAYAGRHRLPCSKHLVRQSQTRQVGASRAQRLEQLGSAFRIVDKTKVAGRHILLVDDVMTTGATLEVAARLLMAAGAKSVHAVVFAQV
jgi:ComF family protein